VREAAVEQEYVSRYRGVSWDSQSQSWRARTTHDGRWIDLGKFKILEEANAAMAVFRKANPRRPRRRISAIACYDDDRPWAEIEVGSTWAKIDRADLKLVMFDCWYPSNKGYAQRNFGHEGRKRVLKMHRVILGLADDDHQKVDHINRNKLDNRRSNLRFADPSQSAANRGKQKNTTSQYRGVCLSRNGRKWVAQIRVRGEHYYLGAFTSEIDAARAYDRAAFAAWGEYANLNGV
jgi:hypothetical protein